MIEDVGDVDDRDAADCLRPGPARCRERGPVPGLLAGRSACRLVSPTAAIRMAALAAAIGEILTFERSLLVTGWSSMTSAVHRRTTESNSRVPWGDRFRGGILSRTLKLVKVKKPRVFSSVFSERKASSAPPLPISLARDQPLASPAIAACRS